MRKEFDDLDFFIKESQQNRAEETTNMILLGTKCDLKEDRKITKEEAQNIADKNGMEYFEVSALTGENVDFVFSKILKYCMLHKIGIVVDFVNKSLEEQPEKRKKKSLIGKIAKLFK